MEDLTCSMSCWVMDSTALFHDFEEPFEIGLWFACLRSCLAHGLDPFLDWRELYNTISKSYLLLRLWSSSVLDDLNMVSGKIRKRSNHKHRSTRCFFFFFFLSHLLSYFERFLTGKRSTLSFGTYFYSSR